MTDCCTRLPMDIASREGKPMRGLCDRGKNGIPISFGRPHSGSDEAWKRIEAEQAQKPPAQVEPADHPR